MLGPSSGVAGAIHQLHLPGQNVGICLNDDDETRNEILKAKFKIK